MIKGVIEMEHKTKMYIFAFMAVGWFTMILLYSTTQMQIASGTACIIAVMAADEQQKSMKEE